MIVTELTIAEIRAVIADMRIEALEHRRIAKRTSNFATRATALNEAMVNEHWANRLEAILGTPLTDEPQG